MVLGETIERLRKVKAELATLFVLVSLVVVLGALLVRWPEFRDVEIGEPVEGLVGAAPEVSSVPERTEVLVSAEQSFEEVILVTEGADYKKSWQVEIEGEVTVEEVLGLAVERNYLDVGLVDYGGSMGVFIESLDGVANSNTEKTYWHLYINDVLSSVGASQAKVRAGDRVIWKYERQHDEGY
jgi:hypothetical protein